MNYVCVMGNLGKDPQTKVWDDGGKTVNLSVATTERWKSKTGEQQERTDWHFVAVKGPSADFCEQFLKKGSKVIVQGKLKTIKKDDGSYMTMIDTFNVQGLDSRSSGQTGAQAQQAQNTTMERPRPELYSKEIQQRERQREKGLNISSADVPW